jgi:hypothetical protein
MAVHHWAVLPALSHDMTAPWAVRTEHRYVDITPVAGCDAVDEGRCRGLWLYLPSRLYNTRAHFKHAHGAGSAA